MKRDPRTVERVLLAASEVHTESAREAAVLGGLVRSLLDTGHLKVQYVRQYVPQCIAYYANDVARTGEMPNGRRPDDAEIRKVASKFLERYDPDRGTPAAA